MKRNTLNLFVDLLSGLVALAMIMTGLIMRFALPPGSGSRRVLWGMGRHDWGDLHFWLATAIGGIVAVHVALHWQWVCATIMRFLRPADKGGYDRSPWARNLVGAMLLLLLVSSVAAFVPISKRSVREVRGQNDEHIQARAGDGHRRGGFIQGSMTLSDVAASQQMTVETVKSRLGLPADISADERMGRLSKRFGFSMHEAREKLEEATSRVD